jgi:uncharacterized protein YggE
MQQPFSKSFMYFMGGIFLTVATVLMVTNYTGGSWFKNIKAEITSQPYARTITVDGEGKITTKPDVGIVELSVVSKGLTVKIATEDGNKKMTAVIEAVKNLGIESKDITSSQYSLYPQYNYENYNAPKITGYSLSQSITVKIRDLEKVDDVLEAGVAAGSNQIGQLTFDVDDMTKIKKEAREKAFDAAKEKAEEMADAAGVKLGRVVTFSEGYDYMPPIYANYKMEYAMDSAIPEAAPSIEPGSKELNISVSVTYEIE